MATGGQSFYELYRRSRYSAPLYTAMSCYIRPSRLTFRSRSIGLALTDTLDDLIEGERINPQLAMKILGTFDQAITEALQKNVKNRLQFKVNSQPASPLPPHGGGASVPVLLSGDLLL